MRRAFSDVLLSIGAVFVLLTVLVVADPEVRQELNARMGTTARASREVESLGTHAHGFTVVVIRAVKEQADQHGPMMFFIVAATALTMFMVRT
jgi:hypothetical protein